MSDADFIQHGPKKPMPVLEQHLGEFYQKQLESNSDNVAIVTEVNGVEISLTFGEILRRGKIVSCVLQEHGLKSGDTLIITCGNTVEFLPAMLGGFFTGVACSPINPDAGTSDFKHLLGIMKPSLVLCDTHSYMDMLDAVAQYDVTTKVMTLDDLAKEYGRTSIESFQMALIADFKNHVALVMTSSGTTGRPKGVEISHAILLNMLLEALATFPSSFVGLNLAGPFWISGILTMMMFLAVGAKLVLLPKFTEKAFLETIQKYKVKFTSIGPDKLTALAKWSDTEQYDTSSLVMLACGGARVSQAMQDLAEKRLKTKITIGYGMTESIAVFETSPMGDLDKPAGTVGKIMANNSAKIVDVETGKALGPNCEGEICFKTTGMLKGYRGNPEATKELFDEDGFLHSGDIGYYDNKGYFFVIDRIKELIKYKNIQVPAQDIEDVLLEHASVQQAAVVGIPNDEDGEHATAFIIKKPGTTVTEQELVKLVEGKLPLVKWLHGGVVFVDSFPRTASEKVKKRDLRTMHVANMAAAAANLQGPNKQIETSVNEVKRENETAIAARKVSQSNLSTILDQTAISDVKVDTGAQEPVKETPTKKEKKQETCCNLL